MKTSILIITYNNIGYTKLCIESIRKYTKRDEYELIIVDNNSSDGTIEWIKEQQDIKYILNKENLGFPTACNQGIEIAEKNDILLLNNDIIVTTNWLENLKTCLYSDKTIGAVGAITNSCSNFQAIGAIYDIGNLNDFAKRVNISNEKMWEERLRLIGFCMLIKREVLDRVGLLDERFSPGNFEDDDYSLRIRKAGYRLMLCKDVYIHHFGSVSFGKGREKLNELLQTNYNKFQEKWNINYSQLLSIHLDVPNYIDRGTFEKFSFLEIGCNGGGTLTSIKNKYKNSDLYGVEANKDILINLNHIGKIASSLDEIIQENNKVKFDYVLLKEISLEMNLKIIRKIKYHINKGGKIIIIIHNFNAEIYKAELIKNLLIDFKALCLREYDNGLNKIFIADSLN
ncbi:glycosyltransferase family 2 protein [Clostridium frigidicarnis]|uniref:Glycosyltransferase, GT2 family n=1 Tax=Clostridium frigidicarnis TaxID=84698 RepID=A0A1I0X888_9CLOT|nr:glycosyltransferase family 2 protein [Clostridium frigidicarnis]SFA97064.1 Glycosyltransferase, GT2 family [Clostridium frigidicarnis]